MNFIHRIQRDLTKHRQKAAILAALLTIMVVMTVRAVLQLQPKPVSAALQAPEAGASDTSAPEVTGEEQAQERIRQSKELWHQLREVRGADVAVAFTFDGSFYPLDPNRRTLAVPQPAESSPTRAPVEDSELLRRTQITAVREQAKQLLVKSTTVSSGKPLAVVNQALVSVGDQVNGFEITAIRSREVEFRKDGVTIAVRMPDDLRGQ